MESREIVTYELKAMGKSKIFIAFVTLLTVAAVLNIISIVFIPNIIAIIITGLSVLSIVGLWLQFAACFNDDKFYLSMTGLSIYKISKKISFIIKIVLCSLVIVSCIVCFFVLTYFGSDEILSYVSAYLNEYLGEDYAAFTYMIGMYGMQIFAMVLISLIVAIGIYLLIICIFYPKLFKTLNAMKKSAKEGTPVAYASGFVNVILWILFIIMILAAVFSLLSLGIFNGLIYLLSAFVYILAAMLLRHFKGAMMNVEGYLASQNQQ